MISRGLLILKQDREVSFDCKSDDTQRRLGALISVLMSRSHSSYGY